MRAVDRKPSEWYYLKLDISKYFYRVDHRTLMDILRRKIDDEDLLWLLGTIINCEHTAFGLPLGLSPDECDKAERLMEVGMPIGNLTSQMFANIYLNELDQFAKHELRLRYYIRYMDDVIILHQDKKYLHEVKDRIEVFLNEELRLHLNNKTAIRKVKSGIEFVGFRIFPTHRKYKKKSLRKLMSRLKYVAKEYAAGRMSLEKVNATVQSYYGAMQHFNSYGLRRKLSQTVVFKRTTPEMEGSDDAQN
jgi:retron-type reverse transcriptase